MVQPEFIIFVARKRSTFTFNHPVYELNPLQGVNGKVIIDLLCLQDHSEISVLQSTKQ